MSIQLTNPFAFLEFRYPQPSDELQSQLYEIPGVKPPPLFQSLQDQTQKSAKEAAKGTTCAGCSKTTAPRWYKNPQDPTTKICNACYQRIRSAEETAKGTTCADCSKITSHRWYKNPQDPRTKICQACYRRIQKANKAADETAKGTTCADCSTTTSRRWCTNPQDPTTKICAACYQRIRNEKKAAEETAKGTSCAGCSRITVPKRYKNPQDLTTKICQTCYLRIQRANKAAKEAAKEATLSPVPSRTVASPIPRNKRKKTSEDQISQKRVRQSAPISHPGLQMNPSPFFEPPDALDEKCFSLFSSAPGQSLEESGLPDLENEQANNPINDPNNFLLEDSLLYEAHE